MRTITFALRCAATLAFLVSAAYEVAAQTASPRTYCATRGHREVSKTPPELMPLMQKAFGIDASLARDATYVRCVGSTMMGWFVGANLSCGKADQRRTLAGATAFCRENPNNDVVPMAATGHDSIYDSSCQGQKAVAGKATTAVDAQGYIASNWLEVR